MTEEKKVSLEKELREAIKETYKVMANIRRDFEALKKEMCKHMKDADQTFALIKKQILAHSDQINNVTKTNQNVEETLGNVYLAIRQNEYLQAWYPEQHGFKAMNVIGSHPAKLKIPVS